MCRISALIIALLCFIAPRDVSDAGEADMHLWRGEFDRAIDASQRTRAAGLDAYRTMADRLDEVRFAAPIEDDSLRYALIAYQTGRFDDAVSLAATPVGNPFLDQYRRLVRGLSLLNLRRFEESVRELDSLLVLIANDGELDRHPVLGPAANAFVEAMAASGDPRTAPDRVLPHRDMLSSRSRFLLSRICLEAAAEEEAQRWFFAGLESEYDSTAFAVFEEIAARPPLRYDALGLERIASIAEYALSRPTSPTAQNLTSHLREKHGRDGRARMLEARFHAAAGDKRRAVSIARDIVASSAELSIKKQALLLAASWEYEQKRYREAQESYRVFGMYYPSDPRSARSLDIAARIAVSRRRWKEALSIWETLRLRNERSPLAQQAALSEAVLRFREGAPAQARRILEASLPGAHPAVEAGLLYWLHRTSPSAPDAERWRERLIEAYPRSFYASAVRGANGLFTVSPDEPTRPSPVGVLEKMERFERTLFAAVAAPPDTAAAEAAYQAYRYFLARGFRREATECGMYLAKRYGGDRDRTLVLYRDARSRGLIGLALSIASTATLAEPSAGLPAPLRYPVAYTGLVAEIAEAYDVPPILVLAVMREESRFDPAARSRAGAVGLMQLMPSTAAWLATEIEVLDYAEGHLLSPSFNVTAGSWYLSHLIRRSDGSLVAALAAYNAGSGRVAEWIRTFEPAREPMIAIEMIGIKETRDYVKRVLDTMAAYRTLYPTGARDEG